MVGPPPGAASPEPAAHLRPQRLLVRPGGVAHPAARAGRAEALRGLQARWLAGAGSAVSTAEAGEAAWRTPWNNGVATRCCAGCARSCTRSRACWPATTPSAPAASGQDCTTPKYYVRYVGESCPPSRACPLPVYMNPHIPLPAIPNPPSRPSSAGPGRHIPEGGGDGVVPLLCRWAGRGGKG